MSARQVLLEVKDLSVQLQRGGSQARSVLSDVAFTLAKDEVIGIIGESGSGKTVLSRALVNWVREPLRVTSGSLVYHGRNLLRLPEREMQRLRGREIAFIFLMTRSPPKSTPPSEPCASPSAPTSAAAAWSVSSSPTSTAARAT